MGLKKSRDDFSLETKRLLAEQAGQICSNPECRINTSGPHPDPQKRLMTGVASHISAAAPGGPRYDPNMAPEQRKSIDNGIWLCEKCAKIVDSDPGTYTAKILKDWKIQHHEALARGMKGNAELMENVIHVLDEIKSKSAKKVLRAKLEIVVETDSDGLPIWPHISASSTDPIAILFKVFNRSSVIIKYLQAHAWLLYPYASRDPEVWDSSPWQPEDVEDLPKEFSNFGLMGQYRRYILQRSPNDNFFLMNSAHPIVLPAMEIKCRRFTGMIPIPWKIETPNMEPIMGVLMLWVDDDGKFTSESTGLDTDWDKIVARVHELQKAYHKRRGG